MAFPHYNGGRKLEGALGAEIGAVIEREGNKSASRSTLPENHPRVISLGLISFRVISLGG